MKKRISAFLLILLTVVYSQPTFAWGKRGHEMIGQIAYNLLDEPTRELVKKYIGNISFPEAANWMDDERSNSYYNYMRTWHYIDFDKGTTYIPSTDRNILTILHSAIVDLRLWKTTKRKDVKRDILLIFHLVGDLHQPLHTGYSYDRGGNDVQINSNAVSGNLHSVWDTQIIDYMNVTLDTCMNLYKTLDPATVKGIEKIDEMNWMYQSRSFLDTVYSFNNTNKNNYLDQQYITMSSKIIKMQLVRAGIRLASILRTCLKKDGPVEAYKQYQLMMRILLS